MIGQIRAKLGRPYMSSESETYSAARLAFISENTFPQASCPTMFAQVGAGPNAILGAKPLVFLQGNDVRPRKLILRHGCDEGTEAGDVTASKCNWSLSRKPGRMIECETLEQRQDTWWVSQPAQLAA